MQKLPDGGYTIDDRIEIAGEGAGNFVFGAGWLLEILELERGEYYFLSDGDEIKPGGRRFGMFYPAFSIVRPFVRNVSGHVRGIGSREVLFGLPDIPIIFDTDFDGRFSALSQVPNIIGNALNVRPISVNPSPSLISIRAKRLIDENFSIYPSIARVASRIGVSHEHLSRQFKLDFGMTPSGYLHQLRVAEATFRLTTGEPIIDISLEVGYNDLSRFYKQFRKATKTSPAECRTMLEG